MSTAMPASENVLVVFISSSSIVRVVCVIDSKSIDLPRFENFVRHMCEDCSVVPGSCSRRCPGQISEAVALSVQPVPHDLVMDTRAGAEDAINIHAR